MSTDADKQDFGELLGEPFDFIKVIWKVPDVLSLPDLVDYKVQSPSFSFADATWKLEIYPYGETEYNSEGSINLGILRLNYLIQKQEIFYKLYFKTFRRKEFVSVSGTCCYDIDCSNGGNYDFMKKSKFMQMKNALLRNGTLTIVCEMRTKKLAEAYNSHQIQSTKSLIDLAEEQFKEESLPSTSGSIELAEEQFKEESLPCTSGSKEISEEKSNEESESSTSASESCDCRTQHITAYPSNKMLQDFRELFLNQEHWDVVIKVKGKEFHAHKAILTARSSVLASTFRNDMKEKASGVLDIEDLDPSSFADFLCFLYCGNAESITVENVFSLFTAADKYDVEDLRLECVEFMKRNLSVDTFCDTIVLAVQHSDRDLIELTTDFFKKNLPHIIVTVKWQSLLIENPIVSNELLIKALASNKT